MICDVMADVLRVETLTSGYRLHNRSYGGVSFPADKAEEQVFQCDNKNQGPAPLKKIPKIERKTPNTLSIAVFRYTRRSHVETDNYPGLAEA